MYMTYIRRRAPLALAAGLLLAVLWAGLAAPAEARNTKTWNVTVTNLTTGQPFSAPLWAVHTNHADLWSVGELATAGHSLIAEDAANAPLQGALNADPNVLQAATALPPAPAAPPIPPGAFREFAVPSEGPYNDLSMLWMLVRTNDGFSGLDSVKLAEGTWLVGAYDAGTERNNEQGEFIPGPPFGNFFVRDPEVQPIAPHPGILLAAPAGDLAAYAWTNPVARIEITKAS